MGETNVLYIYIMECYSAMQRNWILTWIEFWMSLENIMLNDKHYAKPNTKGQIFYDSTYMKYLD